MRYQTNGGESHGDSHNARGLVPRSIEARLEANSTRRAGFETWTLRVKVRMSNLYRGPRRALRARPGGRRCRSPAPAAGCRREALAGAAVSRRSIAAAPPAPARLLRAPRPSAKTGVRSLRRHRRLRPRRPATVRGLGADAGLPQGVLLRLRRDARRQRLRRRHAGVLPRSVRAAVQAASRRRGEVLRDDRQPRRSESAVLSAVQHGRRALLHLQAAVARGAARRHRRRRPVLHDRHRAARSAAARVDRSRDGALGIRLEDPGLPSADLHLGAIRAAGARVSRARSSRCS